MYNILIFGTGSGCNYLMNVLDINKVNILVYLDNDSSKWESFFCEKKIVSPSKIDDYLYDYIIIGSQYNESIYNQLLNMKVDKNKILQFYKFYDMLYNPVKRYTNDYNIKVEEVETIITGISYTRAGIIENELFRKAHSFAMYSQDLFYDYKIAEYVLNKYENNKIKYAIIGLAYYCFQYDMSLSSMKNRVILYYNILEDKHNYKELSIEEFNKEFNISKDICDKVFKKHENGSYKFSWSNPSLKNFDREKIVEVSKKQVQRDCSKHYPQTVMENKKIFRYYLELLEQHNIKPIVVVFPASKYYTKYFEERIENEFDSIINNFRREYNFQYIDYFRSQLFTDEDFLDVSHLNTEGAKKFTKILNKEINW